MKNKKIKSYNRLDAREAERKLMPSIKLITQYVKKTTKVTNEFIGYKVPSGEMVDAQGRVWQLQVHAVVAKKDKMRENKIKPIIRKWAWGVKFRVFIKHVVDKAFN